MSKVNLNKPDLKKYPNLSKAKFTKITVQAGEMLFLPAYWWHHVYSVDTTVSINIWNSILWRQYACLGALHNLLNYFYRSLRVNR